MSSSSSSPTGYIGVQQGIQLANTTGLPDIASGPTPGPADAAVGVSAAEMKSWYERKFNDEVAVSLDLMNTLTTLTSAVPNQTVKTTLDNTLNVLTKRAEDLTQSIAELETVAEQASVPFVEEAPPVTGITRPHIFTLQDYILFIFLLTYTLFALMIFFLIGKRTAWSRAILGRTLIVLVTISVLGYLLIKKYA